MSKPLCLLSRQVIDDGNNIGLATVMITEGRVTTEKFTSETPNTAYIDSKVVIDRKRRVVTWTENNGKLQTINF